jgi:hypothetical protein
MSYGVVQLEKIQVNFLWSVPRSGIEDPAFQVNRGGASSWIISDNINQIYIQEIQLL